MSGLPPEIPDPVGIFCRNAVLWTSAFTTLVGVGAFVNEDGGAVVVCGALTLGLWRLASKIRTKKKFQSGIGKYS